MCASSVFPTFRLRADEPEFPMSTLSSTDTLLLGALDCEATTERVFADPQSDHSLFARTRAGDEAAFGEIVARYRTPARSCLIAP